MPSACCSSAHSFATRALHFQDRNSPNKALFIWRYTNLPDRSTHACHNCTECCNFRVRSSSRNGGSHGTQGKDFGILEANAPEKFSISEIVSRTRIEPHQQVFQITASLKNHNLVQAKQGERPNPREWVFWMPTEKSSPTPQPVEMDVPSKESTPTITTVQETKVSVSFKWLLSGSVSLDRVGKIVFPHTPFVPGIYRFSMRDHKGDKVYIGETDQLPRRMRHYRTPGPRQVTNKRLNAFIRAVLSDGGYIYVWIITTDTSLKLNGASCHIDLSKKSDRRLLEHAAIFEAIASGISVLNK